MGDSPRRGRYSESPSPRRRYSRSRSPVRRYASRSPARRENGNIEEAINPGNNLYVTGLSTRVTEKDLEEHFSREGKVTECRLVVDPRTRDSRGFGFVTMDTLDDAERCVKYLNRSTLEGRIITVEKAKRKRARIPTPVAYLGVRAALRGNSRGDLLAIPHTEAVGNATGNVSVSDLLGIHAKVAMDVTGHALHSIHLTDGSTCGHLYQD